MTPLAAKSPPWIARHSRVISPVSPISNLSRLPEPITLGAVKQAIRQGAHIVHFVCHGKFDRKAGAAQLFLADDKVRMVYLSSCQTATRDSFNAFHRLAPQMVAAGIPAAIAMQDLVREQKKGVGAIGLCADATPAHRINEGTAPVTILSIVSDSTAKTPDYGYGTGCEPGTSGSSSQILRSL